MSSSSASSEKPPTKTAAPKKPKRKPDGAEDAIAAPTPNELEDVLTAPVTAAAAAVSPTPTPTPQPVAVATPPQVPKPSTVESPSTSMASPPPAPVAKVKPSARPPQSKEEKGASQPSQHSTPFDMDGSERTPRNQDLVPRPTTLRGGTAFMYETFNASVLRFIAFGLGRFGKIPSIADDVAQEFKGSLPSSEPSAAIPDVVVGKSNPTQFRLTFRFSMMPLMEAVDQLMQLQDKYQNHSEFEPLKQELEAWLVRSQKQQIVTMTLERALEFMSARLRSIAERGGGGGASDTNSSSSSSSSSAYGITYGGGVPNYGGGDSGPNYGAGGNYITRHGDAQRAFSYAGASGPDLSSQGFMPMVPPDSSELSLFGVEDADVTMGAGSSRRDDIVASFSSAGF